MALVAEAAERWQDALGWWERLARVTPDAALRARRYLRMATLARGPLDHPAAAQEHAMIAFICDPGLTEVIALLEDLYRARGRLRDLAAVYHTAAEHLETADQPAQAAEYLSRGAQIQAEGLQQPEVAARWLLRAIRLRPEATRGVRIALGPLRRYLRPDEVADVVQRHADTLADEARADFLAEHPPPVPGG
jgi:tetratricopeptide (TPR) repeat protein